MSDKIRALVQITHRVSLSFPDCTTRFCAMLDKADLGQLPSWLVWLSVVLPPLALFNVDWRLTY